MKSIVISVLIAIALIGGALILPKNGSVPVDTINNVEIINNQQIITLNTKGGYQPRKSVAKAGVPTIIRFVTNGTFDCSSIMRIARMDITQTLPSTGSTDIDIGSQEVSVLQGSCGMGMYPFEIEFTS